jgi:N-acetylneuraminic acid mutarotase
VKKQTEPNIKAHLLRGAFYLLVLVAVCVIPFALGQRSFNGRTTSATPSKQTQITLTFADRVAYQYAIEDVYWRHRIWPAANGTEKPSLDKVMSQGQIQKKVEDYLRDSQALEEYWQKPITPEQLQAEMERMAQNTKQPEVLREIFVALGNDPAVIAECLVRPVLAKRLVTNLYTHDQRFHGELKRRAETELAAHPSVEQMKQISGTYSEVEWIRTDTAEADSAPSDATNVGTARMTGSEWQERIGRLAVNFGVRSRVRGIAAFKSADLSAHSKGVPEEYETIPVGKLSSLQEDEGHYYATAVISKGNDRLKLATIAWMKQPFDSWRAKADSQMPLTMAAVTAAGYTLPAIGGPATTCTDDTWIATSSNPPEGRDFHTAVWTGSEMIVWGGDDFGVLNTGGRYNPSTDSWTATSTTNAPAGRQRHTAVWTGSEMIVWGGAGLNTGGRYNPSMDSWTATSTTNAPSGRERHTAVWTGSQMIVWGGHGAGSLNTGGRYNPIGDSWAPTSTTNAPSGRERHTAIWTGTRMIVWGGAGAGELNTGGRYDPIGDSWAPTSTTNAPAARTDHTAVWTGSRMIVWGGEGGASYLNTGGRYDPIGDIWTATDFATAPDGRLFHTAVWTGTEMIVWSGENVSPYLNTGGRYDPIGDSWAPTSTTNAPDGRTFHTAVWTGTEMIVWGGEGSAGNLNTGGRYNPITPDSWTATGTGTGIPEGRFDHTAVLTGSEMIVWGGTDDIINFNTGGRYNPSTDSWASTSTTNAPSARMGPAVWTGDQMIVWVGPAV